MKIQNIEMESLSYHQLGKYSYEIAIKEPFEMISDYLYYDFHSLSYGLKILQEDTHKLKTKADLSKVG